MFLKKFYDPAVAEAGGDGESTQVAESIVIEKPLSFAEAMAKSGSRTTDDSSATKPVVNKTENKEETKAVEPEVKKVETTTPSNEAKANSESLPPKEEKEEVTPPQKETVTQTQPTWQEVLKSQQPDKVLKELGFDDKTVKVFQQLNKFEKKDFFFNLLNEWETKGDLKGYLKEISTDYSKMAPEEVMRHQLQEEYPKASPKALDALYKKKILEAYNLDSEDPEQVEEGKMLLEAEADKYRDTLVERQKTKLFPEVPEAAPPEPDMQAEKEKQANEEYRSTINKDPYWEKVFEKKSIQIGKGEDKVTISVDPEAIKNVLFDDDSWAVTQFDKITNADGTFKYTPKVENQILTAQFALDPQKFIEDLKQKYLSLGGKKAIEPIENAKDTKQQTVSHTVAKPENLAAGMATGGTVVRGDM